MNQPHPTPIHQSNHSRKIGIVSLIFGIASVIFKGKLTHGTFCTNT